MLKPQHLQTRTLITQHKAIERSTNMAFIIFHSWPTKSQFFQLGLKNRYGQRMTSWRMFIFRAASRRPASVPLPWKNCSYFVSVFAKRFNYILLWQRFHFLENGRCVSQDSFCQTISLPKYCDILWCQIVKTYFSKISSCQLPKVFRKFIDSCELLWISIPLLHRIILRGLHQVTS